jgi:hypothetical protein
MCKPIPRPEKTTLTSVDAIVLKIPTIYTSSHCIPILILGIPSSKLTVRCGTPTLNVDHQGNPPEHPQKFTKKPWD